MATVEVTKENVQQLIEQNDIVFIDFWADWCGPCKMFGPIFEAASEKHPDIVFGKCDTEKEVEVAQAFGIQAIPTLAVFKDGVLLFQQAGALPAPVLEELITRVKELDMAEVRKEAGLPPREQDKAQRGQEGDAPGGVPGGAPVTKPSGAGSGAAGETVSVTLEAGEAMSALADDFVLRRQGVTREFLEKAPEIPVAAEVLEMYRRIRDASREGSPEAMQRAREEYQKWGFDPAERLQALDADTRGEIKAVLRAIEQLLSE